MAEIQLPPVFEVQPNRQTIDQLRSAPNERMWRQFSARISPLYEALRCTALAQ